MMFVFDLKEGLRILEFVGFRVRLPLKLDQGEVPTFTEEEQNSLQTYIVFLEKPVSSKFSVEPEFDGVIIELLDTGIGLDHPSFSDEGVSTPPAKWNSVQQQAYWCTKFCGCRRREYYRNTI
ncbi:hypothetical protein ACFX2A_038828 [Malus domestica]